MDSELYVAHNDWWDVMGRALCLYIGAERAATLARTRPSLAVALTEWERRGADALGAHGPGDLDVSDARMLARMVRDAAEYWRARPGGFSEADWFGPAVFDGEVEFWEEWGKRGLPVGVDEQLAEFASYLERSTVSPDEDSCP